MLNVFFPNFVYDYEVDDDVGYWMMRMERRDGNKRAADDEAWKKVKAKR